MDSLHRLEELFAHFPGIGPRQARRFVYYILSRPPASAKELAVLIEEVRKSVSECERCHRFFSRSDSNPKNTTCNICADKSRDQSILMVVARDSDFETVEKSGAYRGFYFILGGTVPILDKEPEKRIRLKGLLDRIVEKDSPVKEVILSLNATPDGEHTAEIVRQAISESKTLYSTKAFVPGNHPSSADTSLNRSVLLPNEVPASGDHPSAAPRITVLGRGLSTGAELEYVDSDTIKNALKNRY